MYGQYVSMGSQAMHTEATPVVASLVRTDRLHNAIYAFFKVLAHEPIIANPCQDAVVMILLKGSEPIRGRRVVFGSFRSCGLEARPTSKPL